MTSTTGPTLADPPTKAARLAKLIELQADLENQIEDAWLKLDSGIIRLGNIKKAIVELKGEMI